MMLSHPLLYHPMTALGLTGAVFLLLPAGILQAEILPEHEGPACTDSVQAMIQTLEQGRQIRVTRGEFSPLEGTYVGYPADAPFSLWLTLDGPDADNIMASPQLMTTLSATLMADCEPVSLVVFNRDQTGWTEVFGLVAGQVTPFACVGENYNWQDPLPWGTRICGL